MWGKVQFTRSRRSPVEHTHPRVVERDNQSQSRPNPVDSGSLNDKLRQASLKKLPALPPQSATDAAAAASGTTPTVDNDERRAASSSVDSKTDATIPGGFPQTPPGQGDSRPAPEFASWHQSPGISPPDSPVSLSHALARHASSQVSPIDDENPRAGSGSVQPDQKFTSHLPIPRKQAPRQDSLPSQGRPFQSVPNPSALKVKKTRRTKWDDFSGEPTDSDSGRAAQVTPGDAIAPEQSRSKLAALHSTTLFGFSRKKGAEVQVRPVEDETQVGTECRDPWKGASGRAPIVNPIRERPRETGTDGALPVPHGVKPLHVLEPSTPDREALSLNGSPALPSAAGMTTNAPPEPRLISTTVQLDKRRNLPALPRLELPPNDVEAQFASMKLDQPGSRFSATTYASTEPNSAISSPRPSIDRPDSANSGPVLSIMSRKRPVPSAIAVTKTDRKPTPSEMGGGGIDNNDTVKNLPQCPPETLAQNRIEALEARRDVLIRRRTNIDTIIHELTQVIQPSSVAYDMAARDEIKKTVTSLGNELAEIRKEEHEIGLKILKAWKKRDEEEMYGSECSLWVKRVTS